MNFVFDNMIDDDADTTDDSDDMSEADDSSDDDEDDEDNVRERRHIYKIQNYVKNTIPLYDNETFQSHFRLQRPEVQLLIERYQQSNYLVNNEPNEGAITHEKAFLLTLYYLANTETFREISDRFDLTMSSAHRVLQNTLSFIISLQDEYLVWPHNRQDKREISQRFSEIHNIHGVIGAIDGCHIRIKRPTEQQRDYYNRKQFHSIVLQAVATSNNLITDVHIGEPGSMYDSRVLRKSPLYAAAHDNPDFFDGYFLLGDSAYANLLWLVPPFRDNGHLTDQEREFNYRHSSTRVRIEHTFGLLKGRLRRLNKFNNVEYVCANYDTV